MYSERILGKRNSPMQYPLDRVLIYDDMDGYYDVYIFNTLVDEQDIKKVILDVKTRLEGEWTLEDIQNAMKNKFDIKEIILFDNTGFARCGTIEVNKIN